MKKQRKLINFTQKTSRRDLGHMISLFKKICREYLTIKAIKKLRVIEVELAFVQQPGGIHRDHPGFLTHQATGQVGNGRHTRGLKASDHAQCSHADDRVTCS
jgi:hypothetical protein